MIIAAKPIAQQNAEDLAKLQMLRAMSKAFEDGTPELRVNMLTGEITVRERESAAGAMP